MVNQVKSKKPRKKAIQEDVVLDADKDIEVNQKPGFILRVKNQSHLRVYEPCTRTVIEPNSDITICCLSVLQQKTALSNLEQIKQNNPLLEVQHG